MLPNGNIRVCVFFQGAGLGHTAAWYRHYSTQAADGTVRKGRRPALLGPHSYDLWHATQKSGGARLGETELPYLMVLKDLRLPCFMI